MENRIFRVNPRICCDDSNNFGFICQLVGFVGISATAAVLSVASTRVCSLVWSDTVR